MEQADVNRRDFLKTGAAGAAVSASALGLSAAAYARVRGPTERIGGPSPAVGGPCQEHIGTIPRMRDATRNSVAPVAVCDVWDGNMEVDPPPGRGLSPPAQRCGLNRDDARHVT